MIKNEITATSTLSTANRADITLELVSTDKKDGGKGEWDQAGWEKYVQNNCGGNEGGDCFANYIKSLEADAGKAGSDNKTDDEDGAYNSLIASLFVSFASIQLMILQ